LRAYSLGELHEMTKELASSGYRWEIGEQAGGFLPLRITYLFGWPLNISTEPGDWTRYANEFIRE